MFYRIRKRTNKITALFLKLQLLTLLCLGSSAVAAQKQPDVRILVDVSGSMKRNDPNNLRIPAVRLVTGILPKTAKAGIWLFAENVESLSAVAKISSATKKSMNRLASRIHNRGLFTNIGAALEVATSDWKEADDSTQRIVILLTDGVVDISKDASRNAEERIRIQQQLFPQLKQLNARIYTIALSEEADGELLAQLSNSTDAWFEAVKTAEELEKVFLKIFEQSVTVPTLPLNNNKFKVDQSIDEFTALVFRSSLDPISLVSPSGVVYEADTVSSRLSWFEEKKFDLITLRKPESGEWKIEGPVDPANRVMVVSDLSLDVNNDELPTSLFAGDSIDIKVSLQEKGNIISRASFLKLIHFSGHVDTNSTEIDDELILEDDGENGDLKKSDGIFGYHFTAPKIDEEVTFELQVSSPTFERVYRRSVRIFSSYVKTQTKVAESLKEFHKIKVLPLITVVDADSIELNGLLKMPDGSEIALQFSKNNEGHFQVEIAPDDIGGNYSALLNIEGKTLAGKDFKVENKVVNFEAKPFVVEAEETAPEITNSPEQSAAVEEETTKTDDTVSADKPNDKTQLQPEQESEQTDTEEEQDKPEAGLGTLWWIIIGVVFNVIMFAGGFFMWKRWKKKQAAEGDDLANALDDEIVDDAAEEEES